MAKSLIDVSDALYDYLLSVSLRETPELGALREETRQHSLHRMQISADQGQFMRFLAELIEAKDAIEVGTFTGFSALSVALSLPDDGKLICCDISDEYTSVGRPYWERAGVAHKIDLRLGPALATLDGLLEQGGSGQFDMIFIDADKSNYMHYYERSLKLLRVGGLLLIDNVLWGGSVIKESDHSEDTLAIRALNKALHSDERVSLSLVPIGDGVTLLRKRG